MSIEEQLLITIEDKYGSLRNFALTANLPPSSADSAFKRGLMNANIRTIISIGNELGISVDALAEGRIEMRKLKEASANLLNPDEAARNMAELDNIINYCTDDERALLVSFIELLRFCDYDDRLLRILEVFADCNNAGCEDMLRRARYINTVDEYKK